MGKVYSPTQTALFTQCPFAWKLAAEWDTPYPQIAQVAGEAFAVGIHEYHRAAQHHGLAKARGDTDVRARAVQAGLTCFRRYNFVGQVQPADVETRLSAAIDRYIQQDPTPETWVVLAAEESSGEPYGWARADVVYQMPDGGKVVRDLKFTLKDPGMGYLPERMKDYAEHPQGWHYLWMTGARVFIPTLVVAHPFLIHERPCSRSTEEIEQWLISQRAKWDVMERMENGEIPIWKSDHHKTQYGKCRFYEFCLDYGAREDLLPALGFVRITKKAYNPPQNGGAHATYGSE